LIISLSFGTNAYFLFFLCQDYDSCVFKCISILSHRLKGKWSLRQRQGFHSNSDGIIYPLSLFLHTLNWYNPSLIFTCTNGEKVLRKMTKGLSSSPFLVLNAKGGENIKPKAKGSHHHFKKIKIKF
jgi:hypothetical protein